MSNNVNEFCESVHEKLQMLQGRMDSLKLNIGTNWNSSQAKLAEVREKRATTQQVVEEARTHLEQWIRDQSGESAATIEQWVRDHDTQKLATRAELAEKIAWMAILIAQASIDDAERMILEAIAAGRDAEAVTSAIG